MQPPTLSFACELDAFRLTALSDDPSVLAGLQALRARVVQLLNGAGVPVVGVPLLPADQGYYFTPDNVPQARAGYARFTEWTLLWSYGPEAMAIAVGTTGGGPDVPGHPQMPTQTWEEFARDLRLAGHFTDQVYVHSLEGCVRQGFLGRLRTLD